MGLKEIEIMSYLLDCGAIKLPKAVTISFLIDYARQANDVLVASTANRSLLKLLDFGYVRCGVRNGRARSYYLTEKGYTYITNFLSEV